MFKCEVPVWFNLPRKLQPHKLQMYFYWSNDLADVYLVAKNRVMIWKGNDDGVKSAFLNSPSLTSDWQLWWSMKEHDSVYGTLKQDVWLHNAASW